MLVDVSNSWSAIRLVITTRTSWMANNAIPDSIIMNMIWRSLVPPVEPNEPNVRSIEVAFTSKNTSRILNTIKPVARVFTAIDAAKPVRSNTLPQWTTKSWPCIIASAPFVASQVARGDKLKSAYQMPVKIDWLTYVCDCQEWRNNHDMNIFTPHDPTTVDLWRLRRIKRMIGTMVYSYQDTLGDEVRTTVYCDFDNWKMK